MEGTHLMGNGREVCLDHAVQAPSTVMAVVYVEIFCEVFT